MAVTPEDSIDQHSFESLQNHPDPVFDAQRALLAELEAVRANEASRRRELERLRAEAVECLSRKHAELESARIRYYQVAAEIDALTVGTDVAVRSLRHQLRRSGLTQETP